MEYTLGILLVELRNQKRRISTQISVYNPDENEKVNEIKEGLKIIISTAEKKINMKGIN